MDQSKLKYLPSHEWAFVEGDTATIGISDFAVAELTDLVFIQLPEVGRDLKKGETFGEVESVKAVSDLYAPVSGKVVEVNAPLADKLTWLSEDPYTKGWMIKVKLSNPSETDSLMDANAYETHKADGGH
ncbi:glycine cleavage system protein H [Lacunimicrobium album]|jgi:glycine cleavage system H protein